MKRERIKITTETRPSNCKGFTYKARSTPEERAMLASVRAARKEARRLDRLKIEATKQADSYVTRLMDEAAAAQRLESDARAYQALCWAKLSQYLIDGTRDDGKKPRIRIVEHDDAPARGQQGAR